MVIFSLILTLLEAPTTFRLLFFLLFPVIEVEKRVARHALSASSVKTRTYSNLIWARLDTRAGTIILIRCRKEASLHPFMRQRGAQV